MTDQEVRETAIMILKGILLYTTMFLSLIYITTIDFIVDSGNFTVCTIGIVALIYICYKVLDEEDVDTLLFLKHLKDND